MTMMKKYLCPTLLGLGVALALTSSNHASALPLPEEGDTPSVTVPWDTAYIDAQPSYNNRADSVQAMSRFFTGPGPFTVHFDAWVPESQTYWAWEFATDNAFNDILDRMHDTRIDYEFAETGTFYARLVTSNADNSYETQCEPYTITVTESLLEVPNLITPDSPSGNNRVFKVKYKSLQTYEMWVFNRWGKQLFHSSRPEEGWDGTMHGKPVPTGAYYYLVKAVGTDGIKYEKKGDINVLRTKEYSNHSSSDF